MYFLFKTTSTIVLKLYPPAYTLNPTKARQSIYAANYALPRWLSGKESTCQAGDVGSILGLGRSPGEMAAHSIILAWEIPWTEKPGEL